MHFIFLSNGEAPKRRVTQRNIFSTALSTGLVKAGLDSQRITKISLCFVRLQLYALIDTLILCFVVDFLSYFLYYYSITCVRFYCILSA